MSLRSSRWPSRTRTRWTWATSVSPRTACSTWWTTRDGCSPATDSVRCRPSGRSTTPSREHLTLTFPDGSVAEGDAAVFADGLITDFYGRPVRAHVVPGPWTEALSGVRRGSPVRLARCDQPGEGSDVYHLTMVSNASVAALAGHGGHAGDLDAARFRMTFELDGCDAARGGHVGRSPGARRQGAAPGLRAGAPLRRHHAEPRDGAEGLRDAEDHRVLPAPDDRPEGHPVRHVRGGRAARVASASATPSRSRASCRSPSRLRSAASNALAARFAFIRCSVADDSAIAELRARGVEPRLHRCHLLRQARASILGGGRLALRRVAIAAEPADLGIELTRTIFVVLDSRPGRGRACDGHRFLRLVVAARDELQSRQVAEPRRRLRRSGRACRCADARRPPRPPTPPRAFRGCPPAARREIGPRRATPRRPSRVSRATSSRRVVVASRSACGSRPESVARCARASSAPASSSSPIASDAIIGQPIERPRRHRRPTELLHLRRVAVPAFVAQAFRQRVAGGDESLGGAPVQLPDVRVRHR